MRFWCSIGLHMMSDSERKLVGKSRQSRQVKEWIQIVFSGEERQSYLHVIADTVCQPHLQVIVSAAWQSHEKRYFRLSRVLFTTPDFCFTALLA
jgi:hypothetical protein